MAESVPFDEDAIIGFQISCELESLSQTDRAAAIRMVKRCPGNKGDRDVRFSAAVGWCEISAADVHKSISAP